ncbi:CoA ester lyase [Streptomyces sp. OspMP-M43]|uniref:HpcH/HpaI aldolase/citrate lyase family protein n=1 Tax=Streptomyces sp. OspMP-M43 TaxID=1839781 RepID=UPI00081B444D|nr:CoA ester lyase [Streptomyces sp. OspMP-M43]SCE53236.1 citrate lyase subunit beta / citryl-CoA lyase/(S)-citramalyl-CoA lyase [Streptomyces sp. OspMP-M43]
MQKSLPRTSEITDASVGPGMVTWLVTPGVTPARFGTALASGADVVLLDLEDSVPAETKETAREAVLAFVGVQARRAEGPLLGVRINAARSAEGLRDVVALADFSSWPDLIVVPKVESARDIDGVVRAARKAASETKVWALVESPRGVLALPGIVHTPGLAGVLFGAADYAAAAGCGLTSRAMWYPRSQLVTAAAAAGIPAVDSPYFDLDDQDGLRRDALEADELGFAGKVAVHPRQLKAITQAFAPSLHDVEEARAVLAAAAEADGAITTAGGVMVGPPLIKAARTVARRAGHNQSATTTPAPRAS